MAALLADENFEDEIVQALVALGHDAITARAAGLVHVPDPDLLTAAAAAGRIVLTHDRDFHRLHKGGAAHAGIVFTTWDADFAALAARIDAALAATPAPAGRLIRVVRPNP